MEPPHWHDVGGFLIEYRDRLGLSPEQASRLAEISLRLRKEREFAFYGDVDFIPTEEYAPDDAERALAGAEEVVGAASRVIGN